jgi:ABC-type Mn2+/Zn2+ transport system permease subunit
VTALLEILSPNFLLRDALLGSMLVGLACPLVGVYFVLRRMIFLGVALPQISSAGIAFSFLVYRTLIGAHEHGNASERLLATVGSLAFTLGGLALLAALERRRENVEARIGVAYAVASAATILFLAADPWGEAHMVSLLKGDILATTGTSLLWMSVTFATIVFVLFAFRREFLLVSFDRDLATVFGWRVGLWDLLLYLTIGTTISLGVMVAGPLVTFGFLVLPTLAARVLTRGMIAFSILASAIGLLAAFFGFYCAYRFDLPLGPAEVAVAFLPLAALGVASGTRRLVSGR